MGEIELYQSLVRGRLEWWIRKNEKPSWFAWFGLYPAQASVTAAKAQLEAMGEYGLVITNVEASNILLLDEPQDSKRKDIADIIFLLICLFLCGLVI